MALLSLTVNDATPQLDKRASDVQPEFEHPEHGRPNASSWDNRRKCLKFINLVVRVPKRRSVFNRLGVRSWNLRINLQRQRPEQREIGLRSVSFGYNACRWRARRWQSQYPRTRSAASPKLRVRGRKR